MSKKGNSSKDTTKKNFPKNKYYIVLGLVIIIVILLFILLVKSLFGILKPNYYSIDSRLDKIEEKSKAAQKDDTNYDVIGWVKVQGTKIDFPVVVGKDGTFTSPIQTTGYGWLSTVGDTSYHNVTNIYGHNVMNLGSTPMIYDESFERFEELLAFTDYDFAKENLYFQYTTNGEDHLYKIFSVGVMSPSNITNLTKGDLPKEELADFIEMLRKNSIYDYDVEVTTNDDIVTLITCTGLFSDGYTYKDIVVSGKMVLDGESAKAYSVEKASGYKTIENEMKGDVDNE